MCAGVAGIIVFFFFQAEDGIRDVAVTGVQTCALPIWRKCRCGCAGERGRSAAGPVARRPASSRSQRMAATTTMAPPAVLLEEAPRRRPWTPSTPSCSSPRLVFVLFFVVYVKYARTLMKSVEVGINLLGL